MADAGTHVRSLGNLGQRFRRVGTTGSNKRTHLCSVAARASTSTGMCLRIPHHNVSGNCTRSGTDSPSLRPEPVKYNCAPNSASRALGGTPAPAAFCRGRSKLARVPTWLSRRAVTVTVSAKEAQYDACHFFFWPAPPYTTAAAPLCRDGRNMSKLVDPRQQSCQKRGEHISGAGRHSTQEVHELWRNAGKEREPRSRQIADSRQPRQQVGPNSPSNRAGCRPPGGQTAPPSWIKMHTTCVFEGRSMK